MNFEASTVPVLLLGFNRPDKMRRVIEPLRCVRPNRVFIGIDGPRADREDEPAKCLAAQLIAEAAIDWPCQVMRLYRDHNLGCRAAVSGAISWAFEHVDELLILEDDCIVDPSFIAFSRVLLDRHRHDHSIFNIAAVNFQQGRRRGDGDYYASKYAHCWGWATWKRAWIHYEDNMDKLRPFIESKAFDMCHESATERAYWRKVFAMCEEGRVDSWAYRWLFACWQHRALTLLPNANLVINIGFDAYATHTRVDCQFIERPMQSLVSSNEPFLLAANKEADQFTFENVFCPPCSHEERDILHDQIKLLRNQIKDLEISNRESKKLTKLFQWMRQNPRKAIWRLLRGKL